MSDVQLLPSLQSKLVTQLTTLNAAGVVLTLRVASWAYEGTYPVGGTTPAIASVRLRFPAQSSKETSAVPSAGRASTLNLKFVTYSPDDEMQAGAGSPLH